MNVLKRLLPYVRPYWSWLVAGGLLAIVVSAADGLIAWLVKPAMDEIFIRRDLTMLKLLPLVILGVYVAKGLGRYGQSYLMASVGERVIAALRRDLYAHIQAMPLAFFQSRHSADLMSRVVVDASRLARLSSEVLVMAFRQVCTVVALLVVMVTQEPRLTLLALIAFPLVGLTIRAMGRRLYSINRRTQEQIAALNTVLQEALAGTKIVKAFGREAHERARFDRGQPPAAGALAQGSPRRRAVRADHGDPGGARPDGHPLVRRLPGDPGRHDARDPLLVRDRYPDALRPRAQAVPDRQPRPADHALRRAHLRDPRPPARRRRRAGRGHAGRLPPARSSSTTCGSATRTARWRSGTSA